MTIRETRAGRIALCLLLFALIGPQVSADDWPQWRGPGRDGVWRETGVVERFDGPQLKIRWRAKISSGYSAPTVADGRVYVMDRVAEPTQRERVLCFDAMTGEEIWQHAYECPYANVSYTAGPRASVTIDAGRAYALGTMGHFHCFDAATGEVLWNKDLDEQYKIRMPTWGISGSPLVEDDLVVVQIGGTGDACLVAFDKVTGSEQWRALDDRASYSSPIVIEQAGRRVLVCWTGDRVVALDPASGRLYWDYPTPPKKFVRAVATPVHYKNWLFLSGFFDGSLLLRLDSDEPAVEKVWHRVGPSEKQSDALHTNISTPFLQGEHIYGVDSYGELRCLDIGTGERVWESLEATPPRRWSTIHFVKNGERVWMFNERGELIISRVSPEGFEEISRAKLIQPTRFQLPSRREGVCWSHPAFAYRHVYARSDEELVCASLAAD